MYFAFFTNQTQGTVVMFLHSVKGNSRFGRWNSANFIMLF